MKPAACRPDSPARADSQRIFSSMRRDFKIPRDSHVSSTAISEKFRMAFKYGDQIYYTNAFIILVERHDRHIVGGVCAGLPVCRLYKSM